MEFVRILCNVLDLACNVVCKDYKVGSVFVTHSALQRTHSTLTKKLKQKHFRTSKAFCGMGRMKLLTIVPPAQYQHILLLPTCV